MSAYEAMHSRTRDRNASIRRSCYAFPLILDLGTGEDHTDTKTVALTYARDPQNASAFNHASMAHNNHHFFNTLTPVDVPMSDSFRRELENSFGSIETLQREFVATGRAMFGPGFVWLVKARGTPDRKYSLLVTYLAGSPYPGAHYRRQAEDKNTAEPKTVSESLRKKYEAQPTNTVGAFGAHSEKTRLAPGGVDVNPILCLNMWEHVYITDYGVRAKKDYIENWWRSVDWSVVESNAITG